MNYYEKRELQKSYGMNMGFDYLPQNYEFMSRHGQNNQYMIAMWEQEQSELNEAIKSLKNK